MNQRAIISSFWLIGLCVMMITPCASTYDAEWKVEVGDTHQYTYTTVQWKGKSIQVFQIKRGGGEVENISVTTGTKFTVKITHLYENGSSRIKKYYNECTSAEIPGENTILQVAKDQSDYEEIVNISPYYDYDGTHMIFNCTKPLKLNDTVSNNTIPLQATLIYKWSTITGWREYENIVYNWEENESSYFEVEIIGEDYVVSSNVIIPGLVIPGMELLPMLSAFLICIILFKKKR